MSKVIGLLLMLSVVAFSFGLKAKTQNPCYQNQSIRIVVLGSSTAAGVGPSVSDSSWVNRYRSSLQALNSNNEVINLAVGGFTTYRIMPHEFVSAIPGRPSVDSNRNITEALSRNPDVIIVNLPSNDRGWPMSEQLNNFDSLWNMSWRAGIPMYIATTQPLGVSSGATYQASVADSILSRYGNYAIEFFQPLADSNNILQTAYNSGDNVHLNDAGHRILWSQVMDKGIPDSLLFIPGVPDFSADKLELLFEPLCADSLVGYRFHYSNLGNQATWSFDFEVQSADSTGTDSYFTITTMPSCSRDSFDFFLPVRVGGPTVISMISSSGGDTTSSNDTARWNGETRLRPFLSPSTDTVCKGGGLIWNAQFSGGDTILWYADNSVTIPSAGGPVFNFPSVVSDTTVYAEAVVGPLTNLAELATPYNVDRDWDGIMFDLVANKDLRLDSLAIRMEFAGTYEVSIHTKAGSYKGSEGSPGDWTLWAQDTSQCPAPEALTTFNFPPIDIAMGDTLGIYFHCDENNEDIVYSFNGGEQLFSDGNMQLITGTGISNTFGQTFFPRSVNATAFYHHGVNFDGQCNSARVAFTAISKEVSVNLGADLTLTAQEDTFLNSPELFNSYQWIDCETGLIFSNSDTGVEIAGQSSGDSILICLIAIDDLGCQASDTLKISWSQSVGVNEISEKDDFELYPNPVRNMLNIFSPNSIDLNSFTIFDVSGRIIRSEKLGPSEYAVSIEDLAPGAYFIELKYGAKKWQGKFIKR